MYTLLIRCEVFDPCRRLYVFKDQEKIESIGVSAEDFNEIAFELIHRYDIKHISLSGARMYMQGIEEQLKETGITTYSVDDLTFKYV
jgi:hypothetical protein